MNLVLFSWFVSSEAFGNISTNNLKNILFSQTAKEIEDDLPPIGVIQEERGSTGSYYEEQAKRLREFKNL